jgi:hypothetical protein
LPRQYRVRQRQPGQYHDNTDKLIANNIRLNVLENGIEANSTGAGARMREESPWRIDGGLRADRIGAGQ